MCRTRCSALPGTALLAVAMAFVIGGGCNGPMVWVEEQRELHLNGKGLSSLALFTHSGEVRVFPAVTSDDSIEVLVNVRVGGASEDDAQEMLSQIEVFDELAKDDAGQRQVRWKWLTKPERPSAVVSYEVHMPPTLKLEVETHNGGVHVEGILADCRLETHNGPIRADDVSREKLSATTHNGEVDVRTAAEHVNLATHNGAVTAYLTSSLELSGEISTHNGSVSVEVGPDASAELTLNTQNGRASAEGLTLADEKKGRNWLSGRLGMGGKKLDLSSHNGSVVVKPLQMAIDN